MVADLNETIELAVQRLGVNGEGVAAHDGFTFFVEGALPGENVQARVTERHKNYGRAVIQKMLDTSIQRVKPICPLFGQCGGCQVMHLDYSAQLAMKQQRVIDAFERIAKIPAPPVDACVASPSPLSYRNKIQLPVRPGPHGIRMGLYARHTHDLVDVDHCYIHSAIGETVYQTIRRLVLSSRLTAYDPATGAGELRYVLIKSAVHTSQALVIFVTACKPTPELRRVARAIIELCSEVQGVIQNLNDLPDNTILGSNYDILAGEDAIEEKLCGLTFKVSPASFFQVNPDQAENLYQQVLDFAALTGQETVLDAYCGVGTLSLLLAKQAKQVFGVECVSEAIEDAQLNATYNQIDNAEFFCELAEDFVQRLKDIDVAVLNPPRKGCERILIEKLIQLSPGKIVYVSCDPATLARDAALLCGAGYLLQSIKPFDMFPQTAHVETVVCFVKP